MEAKKTTRREARKARELAKREAKEAKVRAKLAAKEAKEKEKRKAKEAKEKARRKAKEAKEKAKRDAKEAKEKAKREAKEAKEAKKKAKKAEKAKPTKKKAKPTEERAKKAVEPKGGAELYRGVVVLSIVPPIDVARLDSLKEALFEVEGLRVVMVGGAVDEGCQVLVSAEEPLSLIDILRKIPIVEGAVGQGDEIEVRLKAE